MGLREEAHAAVAEGAVRAEEGSAVATLDTPEEKRRAAEMQALRQSIGVAQDRHGVPESAVYHPDRDSFGTDPEPEGRIIGRDPEADRPTVVHGTPLHLTPEQHRVLLLPINPARVKQKEGKDHVEAWDIRRYLNRIFGFGGWDLTYPEIVMLREVPNPQREGRWTVVYRATARLVVKNPDGTPGAVFEDGAAGDGINLPLGSAHDFALKTALSQALKRVAVNLGDQFGLSLYNKGSRSREVDLTLVGPTLPGGKDIERATQNDQVHGEDEQDQTADVSPDDPGAGQPNGLPSATALRDEVLSRDVTAARINAIYRMVHRGKGTHPSLGSVVVVNENGDDEALDALVYRKKTEK